MEQTDIIDLARRDLGHLLAGETVVRDGPRRRRGIAGYDSPYVVWIVVPGPDNKEVVLRRRTGIEPWERALVQEYAAALRSVAVVPSEFSSLVADDVMLRAIARSHSNTAVVEKAMRFLLTSATETYEGSRIAQNLLIDPTPGFSTGALDDLDTFREHAWSSRVGSAPTTGVMLNAAGEVSRVLDLETLPAGQPIDVNGFFPHTFRHIAQWTNDDSANRVGLSLTRTGEIWIHTQGFATFVYRSGKWRILPWEPLFGSRWCDRTALDRQLKRSVSASILDASLAHHGACLAVVVRSLESAFRSSELVVPEDLWPSDPRSTLASSTHFQRLSRRERLELLSMDGATVIDWRGRILAVGTIVKLPGGSMGGGRLAAARALAESGCAFKVSQDGPVTLFGRAGAGVETKIQFG